MSTKPINPNDDDLEAGSERELSDVFQAKAPPVPEPSPEQLKALELKARVEQRHAHIDRSSPELEKVHDLVARIRVRQANYDHDLER